jgi:hypothetical protein
MLPREESPLDLERPDRGWRPLRGHVRVGPLRIMLTCVPLAIAIACLAIMALRSGHHANPGEGQVASLP